MRHWSIVIILSGLLMGCVSSIKEPSYLQKYGSQGGRGQGFRAAPYQVTEEAHRCMTGEVSGRISRLRVENFSPVLGPGLAVEIQTPDRGLVHVHCGPLKLLDCHESDLRPGDDVTMKVFCQKLAGKELLLASEIKYGDQTLILQDAQGKAFWGVCPKK